MKTKSLLFKLVPFGFALGVAPLHAQLEEIVVTAQKRAASVMDVPIAIEVLSADRLEKSGIEDLDDLKQISSSFNMNTSGIDAQIFIRGVGSQNIAAGAYGSTAVYIDGVYYPRPYGITSSIGKLDDVESIQILKGPQGTVYGRNATAGALVLTTKTPKPGDEFSGFISGAIGDYGQQEFQGGVSGGLSDNLAASMSFSVHENDGFIKNLGPVGHDLDDSDGYRVTGKLAWNIGDNTSVVIKALVAEDAGNSAVQEQLGQFDNDLAAAQGLGFLNNPQALWAGTVLQLAGGFGIGLSPLQQGAILGAATQLRFGDNVGEAYSGLVPDQWSTSMPLIDGQRLDSNGELEKADINSGSWNKSSQISIAINHSYDRFDLVGTVSYLDFEQEAASEVLRADPASLPDLAAIVPGLTPAQAGALSFLTADGSVIGFSGNAPGSAYSGDIYAVSTDSDIEWLVGLYYFHEEGETDTAAGAFGFGQIIGRTEWEVESIAPYGEVNIPLSDALILTAGLRYTKEEAEVLDLHPIRLLTGTSFGTQDRSDSATTYTAKLAYDIGSDWMVYGGYSTGFKSGSVNPSQPETGQVDIEEISSIEVGFKGSALGGRMAITGAAFYYEYDNLQLNTINIINGANVLIDGANAEVLGAEISIDAAVADNATVYFSATVLDHEYVSDAVIPALLTGGADIPVQITGNKLIMTPDLAITFGGEYVISMDNGADISLNGSVYYNSGFWSDTRNSFGSGGDENDAFSVVNTSVRYTHADDSFSVRLYVNNLLDEEYYRGGFEAAGGLTQLGAAGRPRHYGVSFKYNF